MAQPVGRAETSWALSGQRWAMKVSAGAGGVSADPFELWGALGVGLSSALVCADCPHCNVNRVVGYTLGRCLLRQREEGKTLESRGGVEKQFLYLHPWAEHEDGLCNVGWCWTVDDIWRY